MEQENMTQNELIVFLETLAENIEAKATTAEDGGGHHPSENPGTEVKKSDSRIR